MIKSYWCRAADLLATHALSFTSHATSRRSNEIPTSHASDSVNAYISSHQFFRGCKGSEQRAQVWTVPGAVLGARAPVCPSLETRSPQPSSRCWASSPSGSAAAKTSPGSKKESMLHVGLTTCTSSRLHTSSSPGRSLTEPTRLTPNGADRFSMVSIRSQCT